MYCPQCLCSTLSMKDEGVVHIVVNGKRRDNGQFYYNFERENKKDVQKKLVQKVEEFFKWYSTFLNQDPIHQLIIFSNDVECENACKIPPRLAFSVIGPLFQSKEVITHLKKVGEKYDMKIVVREDDLDGLTAD